MQGRATEGLNLLRLSIQERVLLVYRLPAAEACKLKTRSLLSLLFYL